MTHINIQQALDAIALKDARVKQALQQVSYPAMREDNKGFSAMVRIIIAQQLSKKVADSMVAKIYEAHPYLTPDISIQIGVEGWRAYGLSKQKATYVMGLSEAIINGTFDIDTLEQKSDDDIINSITQLKGFGRWSAEIYALFSLSRYDVFPAGDLALQEALRRLYNLENRPSDIEARKLVEPFAPYRGFMAIFLWHYYKKTPTI